MFFTGPANGRGRTGSLFRWYIGYWLLALQGSGAVGESSYDPLVLTESDQLLVLGEIECILHELKPFFNTA